jgi:hypothetical protein
VQVTPRYVAPLLVAAGCVAGFVSAPAVGAQPNCTTTAPGTTVCTSPGGSTSINTSPVQRGPYLPYGCDPAYAALCYDDMPGITIDIGGRRR